ncbi:hypoxanthine phosphoribosyltransferase [Blastopirellula retiformator]|uniref:Hypoxanthine phosphoribosyltransferase n=1 Tax=Blastopirellula retiformator TaxID=2527970 RepID=A0A5C5V652_9BACT|nr:hypoxanthine phosphoribosyltransferase [Blastopirellula retiformator]TWT33235.1 Hypoxanthine-guanine phosphoribosyltransferase [Blastopirellula retiformator]
MRTLISQSQLEAGVRDLAAQLNQQYDGRPLTVLGVLTGSVVLLADLIRQLEMPLRVGVLQARSYRGEATSPGELVVNIDLMPAVEGCDVLLLDDIFDTGRTLDELVRRMHTCGAASVRSMVLLTKVGRCEVEYCPDYSAFDIPNEFVVGYGLDYDDHYRNLPFVAALDPDEIAAGAQ